MATRIDKKISQVPEIASNLSALQTYLLRRAGRKLNDIKYVGLLRNNALSDLEDSAEALTNVLEYITKVDDANEIEIYGTYKPEDFDITKEFVENEITTEFLTPLKDISVAGGLAGAVVSTTPRIRIEDRIDQINSFTGKGTLEGLHNGPVAMFYAAPPGTDQEFGTLKFSAFNENTGSVTVTNITVTNHLAEYNEQATRPDSVVWTLKAYINPATNKEISLVGTDITIKGTATTTYIDGGVTYYNRTYQTTDTNSRLKLKELKNIIGADFLNVVYVFAREYSILNPPKWFLGSPGTAGSGVAYSADDINPETSQCVLNYAEGAFTLYSEREYFCSGDYVETRTPVDNRDVYAGNNITKDSNMRFTKPPRVVRDYDKNWGVRWDGYLRLDTDGTDYKYIFEIETNSAVKIDVVNGGTNSTPTWTEVFNSFDPTKNAKFIAEGDRFISKTSFNLDNLPDKFIYKLDAGGVAQRRYVPITIRMWNGKSDKADPLREVPSNPDIFIKTGVTSASPNTVSTFYSGELTVQVTEVSPNIIVTPAVDSTVNLSAILGDATSSVTYEFVAFEESVTRVIGENPNGTPITETVSVTIPITPESKTLTLTGGVIYADSLPSKGVGEYTLRLVPDRNSFSRAVLWSSRIVTPKENYNGYADLVSSTFEPSIYKTDFDLRPQWWKVSDGVRYLYEQPPSKTNDPLDGFIVNSFKSVLQSNANGVGKYGDGLGVFSNRANLILGEAKYTGDVDSSNYMGMRLNKNLLGEGGIVKFTGLPINNATFDWTGLSGADAALGASELGGTPNHLTIAAGNISSKIAPMNWNAGQSRFFLHSAATLLTLTASDDPTTYGLPAFAVGGVSNSAWDKPIIVNAVANADDAGFTTNVQGFVAPLVLNVERKRYNTSTDTFVVADTGPLGTNEVWLLAFGANFTPAQTSLNGKFVKFFLEEDIAFQFANVDTGESIAFSDVLKITYDAGEFVSALSEVPKVPSERVTPFGFDRPSEYTSGVCYPPYDISDVLLKDIQRTDADLYDTTTSPIGNYDVIWGDHTRTGLDGKKLNVTEKVEFSFSVTDTPSSIITTSTKVLADSDYTHRIKIELPLFKEGGGVYDEDVYIHIGNQEKVKDTYYLFVNGRQTPTNTSSPLLSGIG